MIEIPINENVHTMGKFVNWLNFHNTNIAVVIIVSAMIMCIAGFLLSVGATIDDIETGCGYINGILLIFGLLMFIPMLSGEGDAHIPDKYYIYEKIPALEHSNLTVDYDQNYPLHGKIYIKKYHYKIANITWENANKLYITPTNKVGKATISMSKFLNKHDYKHNTSMYVSGYKTTAKSDTVFGKYKFVVNTKESNKVIKIKQKDE